MFANDLLLYFSLTALSLTSPALELIRDQMQGPEVSSLEGSPTAPQPLPVFSTSLIALCFCCLRLSPALASPCLGTLPPGGELPVFAQKGSELGLLRQLEEAFGNKFVPDLSAFLLSGAAPASPQPLGRGSLLGPELVTL